MFINNTILYIYIYTHISALASEAREKRPDKGKRPQEHSGLDVRTALVCDECSGLKVSNIKKGVFKCKVEVSMGKTKAGKSFKLRTVTLMDCYYFR